jgi:hypothetical protein
MDDFSRPPKTSVPPFTVLGKVPWGGKTPPNVHKRIPVNADQRREVLLVCEQLAITGRLVASRLERDSSVEEHRDVGLVDLLALEAGIRWYRDNTPGDKTPTQTWKEFRQTQRITPTDVLHYACRSIAWLLIEIGIPDVPTKCPTHYDEMTANMDRIADLVRVAKQQL